MFRAADRTSGAGRRRHGWVRWWVACVVAVVGAADWGGAGAVVAGGLARHPVAVDWGDWTAGSLPLHRSGAGQLHLHRLPVVGGSVRTRRPGHRVSDPTSPDYGHYLNLTQATQAFGASAATRQSRHRHGHDRGRTVNPARSTRSRGRRSRLPRPRPSSAPRSGSTSTPRRVICPRLPQSVRAGAAAQPSLPAALNGLVDAVAGLPSGYQPPQMKVASGPVLPKSGTSPARGRRRPTRRPRLRCEPGPLRDARLRWRLVR